MSVRKYLNNYKYLVGNNNALKIAVLILSAVILAEGIFMITLVGSQKVIVVPQVRGKYTVSSNSANPYYVKSMASYLALLVNNFTPQTISLNYKTFLDYASPQAYGSLQAALVSAEKTYKRNDASGFLSIKKIKLSKGKAVVVGQIHLIIGNAEVSQKYVKITLPYKIINGEFEVNGYVEKNINVIG